MTRQTARAAAMALAAFSGLQPLATQPPPGPTPILPPILRPMPDLVRATALRIRTTVHDGVASTEIDEVLRNEGAADAEATWILPLPENATADGFTMTVGDKVLAGEVLDAQRARAVYEDIVRRRRDPGLLEYFGDGCLRARVFPIPPRGEMVVKVRFRHVLPQHAGMHEWRFPLRAFAACGRPPERVSLDLQITSSTPIKNVLSPLAGIDIVRRSECEARASVEFTGAARDLQVLYSLSRAQFGLNALSYRRAGEDGYFMLLLAPQREDDGKAKTMRCVQFVIDTSGSMAGRKIEQAKAALRFFLRSLASHDRFNVVPFATEAEPFFATPAEASPDAIAAAMQKVDRIEARGGTNIEDALRRALTAGVPQPGSVPLHVLPIVVLLSDGEPTVGQTDRDKLLAAARDLNRSKTRVFVFGVGDAVDTKLLDRLADENGGARDYVREDEDIESKTSDLFTKLSHPALTDLALQVEGLECRDVHPKQVPDLFVGGQLVVVGRYAGGGKRTIRLAGAIGGARHEFTYEGHFAEFDTRHDFVATLWAQRKVAQLLDAIRLNGQRPELLDEVRRLAKEFGIVTPFTSHLIVEEGMRLAGGAQGPATRGANALPGQSGPTTPGAAAPSGAPADGRGQAAADQAAERLRELGEEASGAKAVADSLAIIKLRAGHRDEQKAGRDPAATPTQRVGSRTFYRVGDRWIDGASPTDWQQRATRIVAFSAEYFALLAEHKDLAAALALGSRVVLVVGERVLDIVPPENG